MPCFSRVTAHRAGALLLLALLLLGQLTAHVAAKKGRGRGRGRGRRDAVERPAEPAEPPALREEEERPPRPRLGSGNPVTSDTACGNTCDVLALPDPTAPASTTTNTAAGVKALVMEAFKAMRSVPGAPFAVGSLGAGLLSGISAAGSTANPAYETYKLQVDIKKSTDYLACKIDATVGTLNTAADQRMNDDELTRFNTGLTAIIDKFNEQCGSMNCLNFTRLPPSQRSQYKLDCALDEGPSAACPVGAAFDPDAPTYCTFDIGGRAFPGLCDPNGHCYDVYKYDQAVKSVRDIVDMFATSNNLDNFNRFTNWYDTQATLALAKGALVKILFLQQLIMLDGVSGDNGVLTQFSAAMADKLEQRYNFTLNAERVLGLVNSQSRPNLAHNNYAPSIVVWPFERNATDPSKDFNNIAGGCQCVGGAFTRDAYEYVMGSSTALTIKAQVFKSCRAAPTVVESKCLIQPYMSSCGRYNPGFQDEFCYTLAQLRRNCPGAWDRCVNNVNQADWSDFVGPWEQLNRARALLNQQRCPDVVSSVKNAIEAAAASLFTELKENLQDVRAIIDTLRNITSTGGMPRAYFGALRNEYPLYSGVCNPQLVRSASVPTGTVTRRFRCGSNCESCQPSWRCLKCAPGYELAPSGAWCTK